MLTILVIINDSLFKNDFHGLSYPKMLSVNISISKFSKNCLEKLRFTETLLAYHNPKTVLKACVTYFLKTLYTSGLIT